MHVGSSEAHANGCSGQLVSKCSLWAGVVLELASADHVTVRQPLTCKAVPGPHACQLIPPVPSLFARFRPYLAHFYPVFSVFCAFSPSRRGGSNEPQAGTRGQETAGKGTKSSELRPSFDTAGAVGRITWVPRTLRGNPCTHSPHARSARCSADTPSLQKSSKQSELRGFD